MSLINGNAALSAIRSPVEKTSTKGRPSGARQLARQRNFQAADASEIYQSWTSTTVTPDELVYKSLRILRARSRNLMGNNDMAKSFVRLCENHIVGDKGFRFCAKSRDTNGELDKDANQALQNAWKHWGEDGYCDFYRKHDDASFDRLLVHTVAVDGEAFVQELRGDRFGIAFRLYDPETVPIEYNRAKGKNQNLIRFGIEYDRDNRPVAYYFRDRDGNISFNLGYEAGTLQLRRVPASQIQHVYIQDRIDLRRGFPWMAASMVRFKMIGKFEDAAIQNAVVGASKVGIISGDGSEDIVDDIEDSGARIMETEHVGLYQTDAEVKFDTFDTAFPSNEYGPFIKTNTMFLAAGVGVNYNSLSGDLAGVNYSSLKHGTTEEREHWKVLQAWFILDWKRPQFFRWLKMALLIGIPMGPRNKLRAQDHAKYSVIEFFGRRWIGPDPLKESTASAVEMKSNTKSPQQVMRDKGYDPDEVIEEIADFHAKMRELELPVDVGANAIYINTDEGNEQTSPENSK